MKQLTLFNTAPFTNEPAGTTAVTELIELEMTHGMGRWYTLTGPMGSTYHYRKVGPSDVLESIDFDTEEEYEVHIDRTHKEVLFDKD